MQTRIVMSSESMDSKPIPTQNDLLHCMTRCIENALGNSIDSHGIQSIVRCKKKIDDILNYYLAETANNLNGEDSKIFDGDFKGYYKAGLLGHNKDITNPQRARWSLRLAKNVCSFYPGLVTFSVNDKKQTFAFFGINDCAWSACQLFIKLYNMFIAIPLNNSNCVQDIVDGMSLLAPPQDRDGKHLPQSSVMVKKAAKRIMKIMASDLALKRKTVHF